jgi:signal transduction histidine kinase
LINLISNSIKFTSSGNVTIDIQWIPDYTESIGEEKFETIDIPFSDFDDEDDDDEGSSI